LSALEWTSYQRFQAESKFSLPSGQEPIIPTLPPRAVSNLLGAESVMTPDEEIDSRGYFPCKISACLLDRQS
jgi:hypothetical protein